MATVNPYFNPEWPLFLAVDFGWNNNFTGWLQPSHNGDRVVVLFGHYQAMRSNEENARIALKIHQDRGYGPLTGGWGDASKPEALRSYSQIFGADILPAPGRVEQGQETVRQWLKAAAMTRGESGLVFSRHCPKRLFQELHGYKEHVPGTGPHHALDAIRYFFKGWTGASKN